MIARVRVLRRAIALDRSFDYQVPRSLGLHVSVGSWVRVPFGTQVVQGIVVELPTKSSFRKLKPIQKILQIPPLTPDQLSAIEWMSKRYLTNFSTVASLFAPPAGSYGE